MFLEMIHTEIGILGTILLYAIIFFIKNSYKVSKVGDRSPG